MCLLERGYSRLESSKRGTLFIMQNRIVPRNSSRVAYLFRGLTARKDVGRARGTEKAPNLFEPFA